MPAHLKFGNSSYKQRSELLTGKQALRRIRLERRLTLARPPQRSWWDNIYRNRRRFGFIIGLALALIYFILAGLVPAAYVQKDYINGDIFISLYSPAFRGCVAGISSLTIINTPSHQLTR